MRKLLTWLLVVMLFIGNIPEINVSAATIVQSGTCGEKLTWTLDDEGTLVISGIGKMDDYSSSRGPWGEYIKNVCVETGVTSIGESAFWSCRNLNSIKISDSVTSIGNDAFLGCNNLIDIAISENVASIGDDAFLACDNLKNIEVSENNKQYCSVDGVLYTKNMKTLICYGAGRKEEEFRIPEGITSIKMSAFCDCSSLNSIIIPKGVTSIGYYAFENCSNLNNIIIPEGVTSIKEGTFAACSSLKCITIPEGMTSIGTSAFSRCTLLNSVIIPKSVTSIAAADSAFYSCKSDLTFYGVKGSYAETYATKYNINFTEYTNVMDWKSNASTHWKECICGEKKEETTHIEDAGVVTKEPTETETGLRTYKCTECGFITKTEEIAALPPSHIHDYGKDWKSDAATHWKECSCGEKSENTAHTEDNGTVTKEPTKTETGLRTYKCTECGYITKTEEIELLPISTEERKKNHIQMNKKISFGWTGNSLTVTWNKLKNASGYDIYAAVCGNDFDEVTLSVEGNDRTHIKIKKVNGKKISKTITYKVKIYAYRLVNGKKQYIGASNAMHVAGSKNRKITNAKKIRVAKKAYTIKKGKTKTIKAYIVKCDKKKKLLSEKHGPKLMYTSSDESIATVKKSGGDKSKEKRELHNLCTCIEWHQQKSKDSGKISIL